MESYKLKWKSSAKKELKKIPKNTILTILNEIEKLCLNPFPINHKKIQGINNIYRLKVDNYRIIYKLENDELIIEIIRVRHRKDVYNDLIIFYKNLKVTPLWLSLKKGLNMWV